MNNRRCRYCRQAFQPNRYHPQQQVCTHPPRMPEPTPLRLSSAEDRFRSGVSAGLLGASAEMAQDAPGLLDEISPGPPRAGGTKPSKTALAGPKTAAGESCKQQLGYQPSGEFSIACPFWVAVFGFLQTTSFWCRPWLWVISPPHAVKVLQVARADTGTSEWSCWVPTGKVRASFIGDRVRQEYSSYIPSRGGTLHLLDPSARHTGV
jgi:hypothetical protein